MRVPFLRYDYEGIAQECWCPRCKGVFPTPAVVEVSESTPPLESQIGTNKTLRLLLLVLSLAPFVLIGVSLLLYQWMPLNFLVWMPFVPWLAGFVVSFAVLVYWYFRPLSLQAYLEEANRDEGRSFLGAQRVSTVIIVCFLGFTGLCCFFWFGLDRKSVV